MNNTDIRSLYGLKYNPFLPDLPPEALYPIWPICSKLMSK